MVCARNPNAGAAGCTIKFAIECFIDCGIDFDIDFDIDFAINIKSVIDCAVDFDLESTIDFALERFLNYATAYIVTGQRELLKRTTASGARPSRRCACARQRA